jgi:ribosomal-protein-alanine N-acetyltransferase
VELSTTRLRLREFRPEDFATTHAYASDPEVTKHMVFGPNSEVETRAFLQRVIAQQTAQPRPGYELAVELRENGRHVGGVGFRAGKRNDMGYIFHREVWGRGYATEAARAVLEFGFRELKLHRIIAECDVRNTGSARVMEKLGMRREGCFLKDTFTRGAWRDSYLYAILDTEWSA